MKVLLIDGDNNLHRAYHKFTYMKDKKGDSTSMIYGFPMILGSLMKMFKPDEVVCAFDKGRHERRLEILPDYKERKGRTDREEFNRQRDITEKIVKNLGVGYVRKTGHEADDIIYWLIRQYKDVASKIIIVSRDKDFHQLISDQVSVWNPHDSVMMTDLNKHGLNPKESLEYLIMDGDSSDNIAGYSGVGKVTALALLKRFGSIRQFLASEEEFKRIDKEKLKTIYKRNKELIGIKTFFRRNLLDVEYKIIRKEINYEVINKIAKRHNIKSFNDSFYKPFEELGLKYDI